jgi:uncharacterized protein YprB with RNaseH-like and TPR domain
MLLKEINDENILFLDIETVPAFPDFEKVPERFKQLWEKKANRLIKDPESETIENIYPRAGIYSEFGKIVCISAGFFNNNVFRMKSYYGHDEEKLLREFAGLLNNYFNEPFHRLCAHNGKEFDFPYIARRMLINGIVLPSIINLAGKKPWEIQHIDTMELWKFGDYKNYTSLELLTAVFDIPTPKDDISGADVWKVYWQDNDLERIKVYCEKDVISIVQLFRRYQNLDLIQEADISIA